MKKPFHPELNSSFERLKKPWNEPTLPPALPKMNVDDDRYADHIDHIDAIIAELQSELLRAVNSRARHQFSQRQLTWAIQ